MASLCASITNGRRKINGLLLWENINLNIHQGELSLIIGENGSGKSTLLNCLLGLDNLTSGTQYCTKNKIFLSQLMPESPLMPINGWELVTYSLQGRSFKRQSRNNPLVEEAIAVVEAGKFADKRIDTLSGGQWQRIRIAAALVANPAILCLDEPLRGLDSNSQAAIVTKLRTWQQEKDCAIVVVSHEINHILPIANNIYLLADHTLRHVTATEANSIL